jgi:hypothetical protein
MLMASSWRRTVGHACAWAVLLAGVTGLIGGACSLLAPSDEELMGGPPEGGAAGYAGAGAGGAADGGIGGTAGSGGVAAAGGAGGSAAAGGAAGGTGGHGGSGGA